MLQKVIGFSIKNKLIIAMLTLGLIIYGSIELTKLPIDAVPDITNNQVLVITSAPSLGAPDVERFITAPIEQLTRNIPGIIEQRSFSRFGLSLVTIVFNDKTDVYWARQQVNERLIEAKELIPAGMGTPTLGPVTTGLGEIFQYVVKAKKGYEQQYNLTQLRDIQDWIVRRQLLSTEGVADVSSFGGLLKQIEVLVNTPQLKSFNLSINDVFNAIEANNQNTGGAYVEKGNNVFFIRTEGIVNNLADIENIVVKRNNGTPVLIKNVATVKIGSAVRYGATTYNKEGEVAGAVVMMLKGENSSKVITSIKERISVIEKSLPVGVEIVPFLDRTKMVNNAIGTVETNLLEGALIVVFVLVLFLGNVRAGLVVASVIPLSMLFAVIMMNLFGISGNLMSLGALDFGLLVDGAVIIVEAVMHKLAHNQLYKTKPTISQQQMDEEVNKAASGMMSTAAFGQVIILIVYLPILSLQGIEGKMFKPMAQTVAFAILGALLLSVTYVPMLASVMISKKINTKANFADKIMHKLQHVYKPILSKALQHPQKIIGAAMVMLALSLVLALNMGGEFIPELEEGDFAVEARLLTGSSLTTTIEQTQKAADILLKNFPEVEKVVTKIGAGEIPTDPMPLEAADLMVILKDKKQWKSAETFDELAEKMSAQLKHIPGLATGFQFPVQMRFNELMTGARQDVVCKIFGDDLNELSQQAESIAKIAGSIEGAKDIYTETVTGIPQLVIRYNREAIARFGCDISSINQAIHAAYAGAKAGIVFENDKRYDLTVKLQTNQRNDIEGIKNLLIETNQQQQIPLHLVANIALENGPYQIQREDARRRIVVAFNVRGRDVKSIVTELQKKVQEKITFPAGYYITYGGQYENMQHAINRLSIAVPVALLLILVMLYFTFGQLQQSLLIFSAIPLSAIGGVLALIMRDMPFSISAGIGFIALFGVAVLNGIVMIAEMNKLKQLYPHQPMKVIQEAALTRLRPVLMTAAVASLGFLPMALSNGAGAEVQRPLATVVIGGLITATLLTLLVLPCLYLLTQKKVQVNKIVTTTIGILILSNLQLQAQVQPITLQDLTAIVMKQSAQLRLTDLQQQYTQALQATVKQINPLQVSTETGNYNSLFFDARISVLQSFATVGSYAKEKKYLEVLLQESKTEKFLQQAQLKRTTELLYRELQYQLALQKFLQAMDTFYTKAASLAILRHQKGDATLLEKTLVENAANEVKLQLQQNQWNIQLQQTELSILANTNIVFTPADSLQKIPFLPDTAQLAKHPLIEQFINNQQLAKAQTNLAKNKLQPSFFAGYNNQSFAGWQQRKDKTEILYDVSGRFSSITAGINVPIFNKAQKAKIQAAEQFEKIAEANTNLGKQQIHLKFQQAIIQWQKANTSLQYYEKNAKQLSTIIMQNAIVSYKAGQISYIELSTLLQQAFTIEHNYLQALKEQCFTVAELQYFLNNN